MNYWTGKGYGISDYKDFNGRPFLTYQGPNDKIPVNLYDRVAQTFDFTVAQQLQAGSFKNDRFDSSTASAIKKILGGGSNDELDHKISLELGGSNSPANLFIQPGINGGASAASDTLENNLALDVANGKISLETAWETLSEQKGFLLGENMIIAKTVDTTSFLDTAKSVAAAVFTGPGSLLNPFSILGFNILSLFSSKKQTVSIQAVNTILKSQLDADILQLKSTPLNQPLLTKVFKEQVQLTAQQLQISNQQAGKVVSSYLTAYAQNKGIDAKGMMAAMNADIQKIITASQEDPNIMGVSSATIVKIIAALQTVNTVLIPISLVVIIIGIFIAGPEAILGALSGGLLESIGAIFGVSAITGIGLTTFAVAEALNVAAMGLNMSIKSTYDNKYLLPTQQISALKDALAIQKGLAGFLPSETTSTTTAPKTTSSGGGSSTAAPQTKVFTGVVSAGVLGSGLSFTPRTAGIIENMSDLNSAVSNNLAPYLAALPSFITYDIKVTAHIVNEDGITQRGAAHRIITGYTKAGNAKYKTVVNKFAVVELYIKTDKGNRSKIKTINLGATDAAAFQPSDSDLAQLADTVQNTIHTTNTDHIDTVVSNTPTAGTTPDTTPASTTTVQTTAPATQRALGSTQYYSLVSNGTTQYTTLPWGGNDPYGYTNISKSAYIAGLQNYLAIGTAQANLYSRVEYMNGGTFRYAADGTPYVGNNLLDTAGQAAIQKQISDAQNSVGIYADGYNDGSFSKFQAYAPTPSEQWYTQSFFNSLPASEQSRLKALYPSYNFQYDASTTSSNGTSNGKAGASATTLYDWYTANNKTFPSLTERAKLYEGFGLGPAALYVGSAEQNTQLLAKLKA